MAARNETTTLPLDRYAPEAKALVAGAQALADERRHVEVQPVHLLARALERDPGVLEVFKRASSNAVELAAAATRAVAALPRGNEPAYLSAAMLDLLERAQREAERERAGAVQLEHLLNALSQEIRGPAGELLGAYGIAPGSLRAHMQALRSVARPEVRTASAATDTNTYTRDLVDQARSNAFGPTIGRQAEVRRLLTILERQQKSHPLLVGEAGVGKGAVIAAIARRVAGGDVPTSLTGVTLLELEVGALVAGARLRGELEERVRRLLVSLRESERETILVVRNMDQLFGAGPAGSQLGELLSPALLRGELRMLGACTPEGLRKLQERDASLLRLFTLLPIEEPNVDSAIEMTRGVAQRFEAHHGVEISEAAIVASVRLAKRYVQDRFLPDKAIDLLDESASAKRVETDGMPAEVDAAFERQESLKAQIYTLEHSSDRASHEALERLRAEAGALGPRVDEMRKALEQRRSAVHELGEARAALEAALKARDAARAAKDFAKVGELEHGVLPELEKRKASAEQRAQSSGISSAARVLTAEDVAATLGVWTGIPVSKLLEGEAEKLLQMEARLEQRIIGQDDAVGAVARAVRRGRVGLRDPGKPIGSFLFLGPSGVGKTELAKALAEFLFDDEQALTRMDMSEFMERHMAQRLIGAPPGYADSEQGGFLTEAVRRRPYSVLLFDEVEKAHQDVFNLLLQVLDDGRLTDGRGRVADFSNTVVIMTSNIGSERILETDARLFDSADGREALRDVLLDQLRKFFRPEFLNRIDDVVVFRTLTPEHLRRIVDIQLNRLQGLLAERKVTLELDDAAKDQLVKLGYEPAFGARPLRRAIVRELQDPLAERILSGGYKEGTTVRVTLKDDQLSFE